MQMKDTEEFERQTCSQLRPLQCLMEWKGPRPEEQASDGPLHLSPSFSILLLALHSTWAFAIHRGSLERGEVVSVHNQISAASNLSLNERTRQCLPAPLGTHRNGFFPGSPLSCFLSSFGPGLLPAQMLTSLIWRLSSAPASEPDVAGKKSYQELQSHLKELSLSCVPKAWNSAHMVQVF